MPQTGGGGLDVVEVTPERRDEILRGLASWIVRRRLETPAIFLLEMNRPLAAVGATACHLGEPVLGPLLGERVLSEMGLVLEDKRNFDLVVDEIARQVSLRDSKEGG